MLAVNVATRGILPALDLLEYANHPSGTALSDLRIANGTPDPHNVRMWCLGNEMDGPWQTGFMTADDYGKARRAHRRRDEDGSTRTSNSSSAAPPDSGMPTFGDWERTVLEHSYDHVDYISLPRLLPGARRRPRLLPRVGARHGLLHRHRRRDRRPRGRTRSARTKRINVSFDEWNVWYLEEHQESEEVDDQWRHAPRRLEDVVHGGRRRRRRQPADDAAQAQRPRHLGVARAAGQRDRADHDRARRPGLAADDVLPVLDHEPARFRRGDPARDRGADVRRRRATARRPSSTPSRPSTRTGPRSSSSTATCGGRAGHDRRAQPRLVAHRRGGHRSPTPTRTRRTRSPSSTG